MTNLYNSIIWARQQDDIDVLCLARDSMNQLMDFVTTLPAVDQIQAQQHIENTPWSGRYGWKLAATRMLRLTKTLRSQPIN